MKTKDSDLFLTTQIVARAIYDIHILLTTDLIPTLALNSSPNAVPRLTVFKKMFNPVNDRYLFIRCLQVPTP